MALQTCFQGPYCCPSRDRSQPLFGFTLSSDEPLLPVLALLSRGRVSTDNSGCFVSVRCRNFDPMLNMSPYGGRHCTHASWDDCPCVGHPRHAVVHICQVNCWCMSLLFAGAACRQTTRVALSACAARTLTPCSTCHPMRAWHCV
jgi:hypothetical protein